jgi:hypothetical protein
MPLLPGTWPSAACAAALAAAADAVTIGVGGEAGGAALGGEGAAPDSIQAYKHPTAQDFVMHVTTP